MIYQHEARGADTAITGGIDAHVQAVTRTTTETTVRPVCFGPCGLTGTLMARKIN